MFLIDSSCHARKVVSWEGHKSSEQPIELKRTRAARGRGAAEAGWSSPVTLMIAWHPWIRLCGILALSCKALIFYIETDDQTNLFSSDSRRPSSLSAGESPSPLVTQRRATRPTNPSFTWIWSGQSLVSFL